MSRPTDGRQVEAFRVYFDVADELAAPASDGCDALTLDDLDPVYVDVARQAAGGLGLPWPPHLPAAEDYALTHHRALTGDVP